LVRIPHTRKDRDGSGIQSRLQEQRRGFLLIPNITSLGGQIRMFWRVLGMALDTCYLMPASQRFPRTAEPMKPVAPISAIFMLCLPF
jgi:hypothetical protein